MGCLLDIWDAEETNGFQGNELTQEERNNEKNEHFDAAVGTVRQDLIHVSLCIHQKLSRVIVALSKAHLGPQVEFSSHSEIWNK